MTYDTVMFIGYLNVFNIIVKTIKMSIAYRAVGYEGSANEGKYLS